MGVARAELIMARSTNTVRVCWRKRGRERACASEKVKGIVLPPHSDYCSCATLCATVRATVGKGDRHQTRLHHAY